MRVWVSLALGLLGCLSMFHAAYGASQYRNFLKVTSRPFESVPADIALESLAGLTLIMVATVLAKIDFTLIHIAAQLRDKVYYTACGKPSLRPLRTSRLTYMFPDKKQQ
ncbi:uncharacterized protein MONBRDRAFT_25156 [Monosiga brevicollis MX1]|uniref:Uncharacterized protein n=1 Tax=Monosiga brevicollis TaxID=81824 RepID=A9UYK4_MONBE|nr:uncharacterized protein MONBRDRAFT_25156 [Monosiga brevicollis MX1]EDQ89621.1 predicted protein [Monosiga brevicollis MX1]|eukprot:XP_001745650.1 hypothetical protein [Monosiga brevicollis MX1]